MRHVHCFRSGIESILFPTDQAALRRAGCQQAGAGLQQAAADGQAPRPQRVHPRLRGRPQQEYKVSGQFCLIYRGRQKSWAQPCLQWISYCEELCWEKWLVNENLFQVELPRVRCRRPGVVPHRIGEAGQRLPLPERHWEDAAERPRGYPLRCSDYGEERLQNLNSNKLKRVEDTFRAK